MINTVVYQIGQTLRLQLSINLKQMKKIFIILFILVAATKIIAQELRHSQGNKGLDFSYHFVKPGSAYSLGYVQYLNSNLVLKIKGNYEKGMIGDLETKIWQGLPSIGYSIQVLPPVFFLTGEVGLLIGQQEYSNVNFIRKESGIIYGGFYGIELEFYVNNNIAFLLNTQQIYARGSDMSPHRFQVGGGIRLIIQ